LKGSGFSFLGLPEREVFVAVLSQICAEVLCVCPAKSVIRIDG